MLFPERGLAVAVLLNAGHELPVPGNPALTERVSRNVVQAALVDPVPAAPSLRTLYLVLDLVALVLAAGAPWGLFRSVSAVTHREPPRHRWSGGWVCWCVSPASVWC